MKRSLEPFGVNGEMVYQRALADALAQTFKHWNDKQERCNQRRRSQTVRETWYDTEQSVECSLMKTFRQTREQQVAGKVDNPASHNCDDDEGNGAVPNFRPQPNMCSQPSGDGLIKTQPSDKNQGPTQEIEYAQNEAAPPAVEHAQ